MKTDAPLLYALAFPVLDVSDRAWVDRYRARHDAEMAKLVAPHVTLVFGTTLLDRAVFVDHVKQSAQRSAPFLLRCQSVCVGHDHTSPTAHVFLKPTDGDSITQLHDMLYTGPLAAALRADIPFVPHMTIGTVADADTAQTLCDDLNGQGVSISGRIDAITVVARHRNHVEHIARLPLGSGPKESHPGAA